jgi:Amt family ammonium transporter
MPIDTGATAWVLVSAALVAFMTPGLAFFYGGMVRSKHVLGMLMQNVFSMGLVSVLWATVGFSLAFGGTGRFVGNFDFAFLRSVVGDVGHAAVIPGYGHTLVVPAMAFVAFQMMFAVITPALITGATADRLKFSSYAIFIAVWSVVVYSVVAHWVFSPNGWLARRGALDFAGGAAIHVNAGVAALAVLAVLGNRRGWPRDAMPPHNLPFTVLGTGILWFGWFGFNAGSALVASGATAQAFVNTHLAAAAAMLAWLVVERLRAGHATTLGAASGAVAGLVAITPCAGYVGGMSPIVIGAGAGVLCYFALSIKQALRLDDSLDVIAVHLVGGVFGSIVLGLFADRSATGLGTDGLFFGGGGALLVDQLVAVGSVLLYSFVVSYALAWVIERTVGLRVGADDELIGLDQSQHAEAAYQF